LKDFRACTAQDKTPHSQAHQRFLPAEVVPHDTFGNPPGSAIKNASMGLSEKEEDPCDFPLVYQVPWQVRQTIDSRFWDTPISSYHMLG